MKRFPLVFLSLLILVTFLLIAGSNAKIGRAAPDRAIPWWFGDYYDDFYHEYACVDGINLWVLAIEGEGSSNPTFSIEGYVVDSGLEVVNNTLPFQFTVPTGYYKGAPYSEHTIKWPQNLNPGTVVEFVFYSDVFLDGPDEPYIWRAYIRDCKVPVPPLPSQFRTVFAREFDEGEWWELGLDIPAGGCAVEKRLIGVARNFVISDIDVSIEVISDEPALISATLTSPKGTAVKIMGGNHDPAYEFSGSNEYAISSIWVAGAQRDWKWPGYANSLIFDDASVYELENMDDPYIDMVVKPWPGTLKDFNGEESAGEWHLEICNSMPSGNATLQRWAIILEQDVAPPAITGLEATVLSENSAVIEWQTDEPADSRVSYGTVPGSYPMEESESALVTNHAITLTGLTPGTTYYFKASSTDGTGNAAQSPEGSFTTEADEIQYTLDVTVNGQGTVQISPNKPTYQSGDVVTLTADPDDGYTFIGWSGDAGGTANPIQITIDGNKSVTATFAPVEPNTYTLETVPSSGGTITREPDQPSYQSGQAVILTAIPYNGFTFAGWSGDASGSSNPITMIMDSNKMIEVLFTPDVSTEYFYYFTPLVIGQ